VSCPAVAFGCGGHRWLLLWCVCLFQIIITEAGQRTLDGQTQDQIAGELHPAIDAVLHDLDRWLAPAAN
jgi:hypothetical protein